MYLYVHEEYKNRPGRRLETEELILRAVKSYMTETGQEACGLSWEILRSPKGKPYFAQLPIEFSVSHTENLWVCLMAKGIGAVGVDIQTIKPYSYEKIAAGYYTRQEQDYVARHGKEGFFRIWVRKEAYAKYTGRGLGKYLAEIPTMTDEDLLSCADNAAAGESESPVFIDIDIRDGVKGACCVKEKENIWIRKI